MTDTTYNGWKNYETWNVKLWIDNEEGSYSYWKDAAQECYDEADAPSDNARLTGRELFTREEKAVFNLARRLKDEIEADAPDLGASMWDDMLNAALSEVDWHEIARSLVDETNKTEAEESEEVDAE